MPWRGEERRADQRGKESVRSAGTGFTTAREAWEAEGHTLASWGKMGTAQLGSCDVLVINEAGVPGK